MASHDHDMMNVNSLGPSMDHGHGHHKHLEMTATDHEAMPHTGTSYHQMMMYFHGGFDEVILFDGWRISTIGGLVGSMIACFVMGIVYEGIKFGRDHIMRNSGFHAVKPFDRLRRLRKRSLGASSSQTIGEPTDEESASPAPEGVDKPEENAIKVVETSMMSCGHFLLTFLYLLQIVLAYFLMLIAMTFNTWLFLATTLGATTGYFIFGWRKSAIVDASDHCQ